jgi:hypothetical protein
MDVDIVIQNLNFCPESAIHNLSNTQSIFRITDLGLLMESETKAPYYYNKLRKSIHEQQFEQRSKLFKRIICRCLILRSMQKQMKSKFFRLIDESPDSGSQSMCREVISS